MPRQASKRRATRRNDGLNIPIYGNDASGNSEMRNGCDNVENNHGSNYGNSYAKIQNLIIPPREISDSKFLNQLQIGMNRLEDTVSSLGKNNYAASSKVFGTGQNTYSQAKELQQPRSSPLRQSLYGSRATTERGKRADYHTSYPESVRRQLPPEELKEYNLRVDYVCQIRGSLVTIKKTAMEPYLENPDLIQNWRGVLDLEKHFHRIQAFCENTDMNEAIRHHGPQEFTSILEVTYMSAKTILHLLELKAIPLVTKPRSNGGTRRSSRRKNIASNSSSPQSLTSAQKVNSTCIASSTTNKQLVIKMRELRSNLEELYSVCHNTYKRAELLNNLRYAQSIYTVLYTLLDTQCMQHDAHIIDFDLDKGSQVDGRLSDVRFRFSLPTTGTPYELWLTFKATEGVTQIYTRFPQSPWGCLLDNLSDDTGVSGREIALPSQYSHKGARLVCEHSSETRAAYSLTEINRHLQENCDIIEVDILQLAKRIATAVMNFNCTPWFTTFWNCDNVVLFPDDLRDISSLPEPHFRICLESASDRGSSPQSMIFCLGVVLYELWKYFPQDGDMYEPNLNGFDPKQAPIVRRRINDQMEKWVNTGNISETYAETVGWCLDAPGYTIEEMRDSKMLNEMYEKVICGLERVEKEYQKSTTSIYREQC